MGVVGTAGCLRRKWATVHRCDPGLLPSKRESDEFPEEVYRLPLPSLWMWWVTAKRGLSGLVLARGLGCGLWGEFGPDGVLVFQGFP